MRYIKIGFLLVFSARTSLMIILTWASANPCFANSKNGRDCSWVDWRGDNAMPTICPSLLRTIIEVMVANWALHIKPFCPAKVFSNFFGGATFAMQCSCVLESLFCFALRKKVGAWARVRRISFLMCVDGGALMDVLMYVVLLCCVLLLLLLCWWGSGVVRSCQWWSGWQGILSWTRMKDLRLFFRLNDKRDSPSQSIRTIVMGC